MSGEIKKHKFTSNHSSVDESEFAVTVGFSRNPADESSMDGLILQRGKKVHDTVPQIDGVYVEIPIQRYVVYGGITEAILYRKNFILRFNEEAARKMGNYYEIFVWFELPNNDFIKVQEGLRFVFGGCHCYQEKIN